MLGDRQGDAGHVGFLESIVTDEFADNLPGDENRGHGVHESGGDTGDQVGCAWAGSGHCYAYGFPGPRVSIGHVGHTLLVAPQYVMNGVFQQGIIDG